MQIENMVRGELKTTLSPSYNDLTKAVNILSYPINGIFEDDFDMEIVNIQRRTDFDYNHTTKNSIYEYYGIERTKRRNSKGN